MLAGAELWHSTSDHRPEVQFDFWRRLVVDAFAAVSIARSEPAGDLAFRSVLGARRLGDATLSFISSGAHRAERTADLVASRPAGVFFLNVVTRGAGTATQEGRSALIRAGECVVIDADRPFTLDFDRDFDQLGLIIPKELIEHRLAASRSSTAVRIRAESLAGSMLMATMRAVSRHRGPLSARESDGVLQQLGALLVLTLGEAASNTAESTRTGLLQQVLDEIERGFEDPHLSPGVVAQRVSISVSYLYKLLAGHGTTFGRALLERRLDHAWLLLDPTVGTGAPITVVARRCGFRDSGYFARTFRARYGITATQRRSGLIGPS